MSGATVAQLPLASDFLCVLVVEVAAPLSLGAGPYGERRVVDIVGGRVEGPGMTGVVERGGSDWQLVRSDGVVDIEAHYSLLLDDGARIEVVSSGMRHGPPGVLERLGRGEAVDPTAYFFRTFIRFQTGSDRVAHLNRTMAVAVGARRASTVELTLYRIA